MSRYLGLPEVDVGVAERGVEDLDAHLHGLRRRHLHLLDRQRLAGLPRHRGCNKQAPDRSRISNRFKLTMRHQPLDLSHSHDSYSDRSKRTFALDHFPGGRH